MMAVVRECPLCPADANLWDRSVDYHHDQWLGTATPRMVEDGDYERECPHCGGRHDLGTSSCGDHSLLELPMRRRQRARLVVLEMPWNAEVRIDTDTVIGRGLGCPFGAEIDAHEAGGFVSREHVTILFQDDGPVLRVERSDNSTLLNERRLDNGAVVPLPDGATLRLSTRFPAIRVRLREAD